MAELILSVTGLHKHPLPNTEITESVKALKITSKPEHLERFYLYSKIALVIVVVSLFSVLSILNEISKQEVQQLRDGRYIDRPEQGEGSKEVELDVSLKSVEDTSPEEERTIHRRITLVMGERSYTAEEVDKLFAEGKRYLTEQVLGDNEQVDAVYENLMFCSSIPETGIEVEWEPEDYKLILRDGTVKNDELTAPIKTDVTAVLRYEEQKTSLSMTFQIMPKRLNNEEQIDKRLSTELSGAQMESKKERELTLPEKLDQYTLSWREKEGSSGVPFLFFGIMIAIVIWFVKDIELKQQMKHRRDQLLMDYPELINKFTLLVNAGMTVRQAWFKVAEDYQEKQRRGGTKLRYAYEEMLITVHALKLGASESNAYEQYGRRLGLIPYIKFSSLISQNQKKGNRGFTELLQREALEAFEDRKEMAKRLGEEAGTKLLAPMMFLLIIVFLIILIPAFMAFQV
jgi:hypothetical protein